MKKTIFVLSIALAALSSQAAYLNWQVGDLGTDYAGYTISSASVKAKDADGNVVDLRSYYLDAEESGWGAFTEVTSDTVPNSLTQYVADLGTYAAPGYSYYVELTNADGEKLYSTPIAYSTDQNSDYVKYTQSATTTAELKTPDTVNVWHNSGSAGYSPVPEPTSAILMLFGAAMLGLKRKNRSRA